jgi:4-hydroxybenzoate polyprenyltransferase
LRGLADFLLFSNLFVALCAAAITLQTYILYNLSLNTAYILFVFFATLFLYNLQRLILRPLYIKAPGSIRHDWILEHKKTLIILTGLSGMSMLGILFFMASRIFYAMIPLGILSVFYFLPGIGLRKIPFLKSLLVALIWAAVSVYVPVLLSGNEYRKSEVLLLFSERALFFLSLCVVFNIRDIEHDRLSEVRTVPSVFGIKTSIRLGLSGLLVTGCCSWLIYLQGIYSIPDLLALFSSLFISFLLILQCKKGINEAYYLFGLDGMLPAQLLLVLLFNLF